MTSGAFAGIFRRVPRPLPRVVPSMVRLTHLSILALLVSTAPSEEVLRALPVDPSEITPDSGIRPIDPVATEPEARPLPPGGR